MYFFSNSPVKCRLTKVVCSVSSESRMPDLTRLTFPVESDGRSRQVGRG
jgi:hypothetical protein